MSSFVTTICTVLPLLFQSVTSKLFRATGLTGFDIDIDIGATETTVTAWVALSQASVWHGIGFGRPQMRNCYAIIQIPGIPPTFSERYLFRSDGNDGPPNGTLLDATASNWITSFDSSSDPIVITMTRANDLSLTGEYYTFDPALAQLRIIYAIGSGGAFADAHGTTDGTHYRGEPLTETPTPQPTTTPTTIAPTAIPTSNTVSPTAATSPPTTAISTVTPTDNTPSDTTAIPTDNTPPDTTAISTVTPTDNTPSDTTDTQSITSTDNTVSSIATSTDKTSLNTTETIVITADNTAQTTSVYTTMNAGSTTPLPITTLGDTNTALTTSTTWIYISDDDGGIGNGDDDIKEYSSGIYGYIERGEDWINKEASQPQLLLVCGVFGAVLVVLLFCCYIWQNRKTKKLRETLYQFDPEFLQNQRAKKEKKNYGDIPYVDAEDPDSSIGDHHVNDVAVAAAHAEQFDVAPPDDEEANFRRDNPNDNMPQHQLEESLSVSAEDLDMIQGVNDKALDLFTGNLSPDSAPAPPPPSGPIPSDILEAHRARAATALQPSRAKEIANNRRSSYHPLANVSGVDKEIELEQIERELRGVKPVQMEHVKTSSVVGVGVKPSPIERVKTASHVYGNNDDPPTPVSDEHNDLMISERDLNRSQSHQPSLREKQLSIARSRSMFEEKGNDPALALLSDDVLEQEKKKGISDEFEQVSSPSSRMLFEANKDKEVLSIEERFRALSKVDDKGGHNAMKSADDVILGLFDGADDDSEEEDIAPQKAKHDVIQSGDDVILDIFSAEAIDKDEVKQVKEVKRDKEEIAAQHRGKQADDDPFASLDMSPNDLFSVIIDDKAEDKDINKDEINDKAELKAIQSGNDVILGLFEGGSDDNAPQKAQHGAVQSGDDVILDMFSSEHKVKEDIAPTEVTEPKVLDIEAQHRGKQVDDDPFASLNMSPNDLFTVIIDDGDKGKDKEIKKDNDIDAEAMSFVDGLMAANPEFGDNNNIFGGSNDADNNVSAILSGSGAAASHIVDFNKYTNVADTVPIDYSKLTQISDKDEYKVISVHETVEIEDEDGNIHKTQQNEIINELNDDEKEELAQNNDIRVISGDLERIEDELNRMVDPIDKANDNEGNIDESDTDSDSDDGDPFSALNNDPFAQINAEHKDDTLNIASNDSGAPFSSPYNDDNLNINNDKEEVFSSPLDAIMNEANDDDTDSDDEPFSSPLDALMNESKAHNLKHKTIDIDEYMASNNASPIMYNIGGNDDEIAEETEDEEEDDVESLGSEIIHESPRNSALHHVEQIDPQIFGDGGDTSTEESQY